MEYNEYDEFEAVWGKEERAKVENADFKRK